MIAHVKMIKWNVLGEREGGDSYIDYIRIWQVTLEVPWKCLKRNNA